MSLKFIRPFDTPILSPNPARPWESMVATNPAAWYEADKGEVILIYRAAGHDDKHYVYFGLAKSRDGLRFERVSDEPIFGPSPDGFDAGCVEDPRLIKMGEDYLITYASRPYAPGKYWENPGNRAYSPPHTPDFYPVALRENLTSTGLAITRDFKTFIRAGRLSDPVVDDRDVIIFPEKINGKFYTLHRPMQWCGPSYGTEHPAIWIAACDDLLEQKKLTLLAKAKLPWERKIGGSTPPLRTPAGWLTLYHGVGADKHYRIGAFLLDLKDPTRILHRATDFLFEPEMSWEKKGLYNGVVFPCGNIIIDDTLYVYYGGGDVHCGVCTCKLSDLLDYLVSCPA